MKPNKDTVFSILQSLSKNMKTTIDEENVDGNVK